MLAKIDFEDALYELEQTTATLGLYRLLLRKVIHL